MNNHVESKCSPPSIFLATMENPSLEICIISYRDTCQEAHFPSELIIIEIRGHLEMRDRWTMRHDAFLFTFA